MGLIRGKLLYGLQQIYSKMIYKCEAPLPPKIERRHES
jgi:hypothetical protein